MVQPSSSKIEMINNLHFTIDIDGKYIDWKYTKENEEKQYHQTWIPKRKDVEIISADLHGFTQKEVKDAIFIELDRDIQAVKDHNNKKARERRRNK